MSIDVDPPSLDLAASNVLSEPLGYMQLALRYLDQDAKLPAYAFGPIGLVFTAGGYDAARQQHVANLQAGCAKLQEMANGLAYTAAHYRQAEEYNKPIGHKTDITYQPPSSGGSDGSIEHGVYYVTLLWALRIVATANKGASAAAAKLTPAAIASTVLWLLWDPDDEALSKAHSAWQLAHNSLAAVDFDGALAPLVTGWSATNADKQAFEIWLDKFKNELRQSAEDLERATEALAKLRDQLNDYQIAYFVFALVCLVAMMLYCAIAVPPGLSEALKAIQGVLLNVSAVGALGAILEMFLVTIPTLWGVPHLITPSGPQPNPGAAGTGLVDIRIDWDNAYQAQYEK